MNREILAVVKEPGKEPRVEWIDNTLRAFQKVVGGYIETVKIAEDFVLIVNEEGRLMGLPENITICGKKLVGTVIAAGIKEDEFDSIKSANVPFVLRMMRDEKQDD